MKNENTKTGLIGFFDILGYQNLLERNEPEKIAKDVIPILTNIGVTVPKAIDEFYSLIISSIKEKRKKDKDILANIDEQNKKIIKSMRWLVFSDTVLLSLPIDEKDPIIVNTSWIIFLMATIALQTSLFRAGLPTRGAIDYGKFFIKDTCFAGRTIVTAYQLCSQIEIAACVLSEVAAKEFRRLNTADDWLEMLVVEYLVPMKSGEKHLLAVMAHTYDLDSTDIHGDVMRAFWGNKKDISLSARQKAQNTEQWLQFLEYLRKKNKE